MYTLPWIVHSTFTGACDWTEPVQAGAFLSLRANKPGWHPASRVIFFLPVFFFVFYAVCLLPSRARLKDSVGRFRRRRGPCPVFWPVVLRAFLRKYKYVSAGAAADSGIHGSLKACMYAAVSGAGEYGTGASCMYIYVRSMAAGDNWGIWPLFLRLIKGIESTHLRSGRSRPMFSSGSTTAVPPVKHIFQTRSTCKQTYGHTCLAEHGTPSLRGAT